MLCLTPYSFKLMIENYIENQNGTGQPANDRDHQLCHKFLIFKSNVLVFKLNFSLAMQFLYFSFLHSQQQDNNQRKAASSKQAAEAATGGGTLLKKRLWLRCFPVNFAKFLRTPFLQNNSGQLFLQPLDHPFSTHRYMVFPFLVDLNQLFLSKTMQNVL